MKSTFPPAAFDQFVGVDWSGARGPRLPGLQVAVATSGTSPPRLTSNPDGGHWTRSAFAAWFPELASQGGRVLAGFDFAFSFPRADSGYFFPGVERPPKSAFALWRCVDRVCRGTAEFYAGPFVETAPYAAFFQGGRHYRPRLRLTDERCRESGFGRPESIFRLVGPAQVAKGSLAGMRVLRHLRKTVKALAVWPFDAVPASSPAVVAVDMYPGAFVRMSGVTRGKVRDPRMLDAVLRCFGSGPASAGALEGGAVDDKADALISAAALRHLSRDGRVWRPPGLAAARRWNEGWIFGVS